MGINISLIRKLGYADTEDEIVIGEPDWETEKIEWWNPEEGIFDDRFFNAVEFTVSHTLVQYYRPKDLNDALRWLEENMQTSGDEYYWRAIQDMFDDPNLYFQASK